MKDLWSPDEDVKYPWPRSGYPDGALFAAQLVLEMRRRRGRAVVLGILGGLGLLLVFSLFGCNIPPTSPQPPLEPHIYKGWQGAQYLLTQLKPPPVCDPYRYRAEDFVFRPVDGMFKCDDIQTSGCFKPPKLISYNIHTPDVLRHEGGHAILYAMKDPRWQCFQHDLTRPECNP